MEVRDITAAQLLQELKDNAEKYQGHYFDFLWKHCDKPKTGQLEADILDSDIPLDDIDVVVFSDDSIIVFKESTGHAEAFSDKKNLLLSIKRVLGFTPVDNKAELYPGMV